MILSANTVLCLKHLVPNKKILVKTIPGIAEGQ
jgi:hypothetical protein